MGNDSFGRHIIDQLDEWVNDLAAPVMPPRIVRDADGRLRLEFREHTPYAVMIGKLVRAVSGIRAALALADLGYIAECATLLRIVSGFCTEVTAVAEGLNRGGDLPTAIRAFVDQYYVPKARTPEQFAAEERTRYVSREELLKAEVRLAEAADVDGEQLRVVHRFLNMGFDAYVHGAYETTMELCNPRAGRFLVRGHPAASKRAEFVEAVLLKLHEVIVALEFTAAVAGNAAVFKAARETRHAMDASTPWK